MKINVNSHLLNFEGKEILGDDKLPVEAKSIIANAIVAESQEHLLTGEVKSKAFQIGIKLYSKEPDFTVDQLAFIKERVGFFYNALIYGRICELLENNSTEEPKKE